MGNSRGTTKHIFDYCFELEWEIKAEPPPEGMPDDVSSVAGKGKTYSGSLKYSDVISPTSFDVVVSFKKQPSPSAAKRLNAALDALKSQVSVVLEEGFLRQY